MRAPVRLSVPPFTLGNMTVVSAHDVAAELRRRLPGLPAKKLHKLLYYCQGHHLAHCGVPLFQESVMAWDMGPVVASLWKAEKEGLTSPEPRALDNGQLNTVGYVVSRYGGLTGHDLELLSHAEAPWREADARRPGGGSVRISQDSLGSFFRSEGGPDLELPWPVDEDVARLTEGAEARRRRAPVDDDLVQLRLRRTLV